MLKRRWINTMQQTSCKITILAYNREGNKTVLQIFWQTLNCFDWDFTKKVFTFRYTFVTTPLSLKRPIFPISKQLLKEIKVIYTEYLIQSKGKAYFSACSKGCNIWYLKEVFLALQPRVKKILETILHWNCHVQWIPFYWHVCRILYKSSDSEDSEIVTAHLD